MIVYGSLEALTWARRVAIFQNAMRCAAAAMFEAAGRPHAACTVRSRMHAPHAFFHACTLTPARSDVLGDRRRTFTWAGSVMDSVVGAFLTQNVSDALSSRAYMSLASRWPARRDGAAAEDAVAITDTVDWDAVRRAPLPEASAGRRPALPGRVCASARRCCCPPLTALLPSLSLRCCSWRTPSSAAACSLSWPATSRPFCAGCGCTTCSACGRSGPPRRRSRRCPPWWVGWAPPSAPPCSHPKTPPPSSRLPARRPPRGATSCWSTRRTAPRLRSPIPRRRRPAPPAPPPPPPPLTPRLWRRPTPSTRPPRRRCSPWSGCATRLTRRRGTI